MNIQPYPIQIFRIIPRSCVQDNPIGFEYYPKFWDLDITQKRERKKKKKKNQLVPFDLSIDN